jgi:hypothetical protein
MLVARGWPKGQGGLEARGGLWRGADSGQTMRPIWGLRSRPEPGARNCDKGGRGRPAGIHQLHG